MTQINLHPSPGTLPVTELINCGLWAALSPNARCVLGVLWDFHRQYPDACHPSQITLAAKAGVSKPSVVRAVRELEAVGIVRVLPAPGPQSNTYRIQWLNLTLPEKEERRLPSGASPFAWPAPESNTTLLVNEEGREKVVREKKSYGHRMPDGCLVHSAHEVMLHSYLREWMIPHWTNVSYKALGVRGLHPESTADFVVGPRLLVEHFGIPRIQKQAARYHEKRRLKEKAIKEAGWTLITIEAGQHFEFEQVKLIFDRWALSTIEDAEKLKAQIRAAGLWYPGLRSRDTLHAYIMNAQWRRDGQTKPRDLVYPARNSVRGYEAVPVASSSVLVLGVHYNAAPSLPESPAPSSLTLSGTTGVAVEPPASIRESKVFTGGVSGVVGISNDGGVYVAPSAVRRGYTPERVSVADTVSQSPVGLPSPVRNSDDQERSMKEDMQRPAGVWFDDDDPEDD